MKKSDEIAKLNETLVELGMDPIQDVDATPERTLYIQHIQEPDWTDSKWVKTYKRLRDEYALAFHTFFAEKYPHLLYEEGEDKVYFNYNESTGVYDEMSLSTVRSLVIKLLIQEELRDIATEGYVKNCLARYRAMYPERGVSYDDFDTDDALFHAKNGWVNLNTLKFSKHTPEILSRRVSAVEYNPHALCPRYDRFLDKDIRVAPDAVRVIDQFSGLLLTRDIRYQKMLTIIGRPGSGKSTLLDSWAHVLGETATQKRLTELVGESFRFAGGDLVGRTLCWFDEVDVKRSEMGNSLGTLITGKHIRVERKGINGILNVPNGLKCVLTANNLPHSSEHGMYRRLLLIYFDRSFYDEGISQNTISEELEKESSGILNRMIKGLKDLRKMQGFTVIQGHEDLIEEYKMSSDSVAEFLSTYFEYDAEAEPIETRELFRGFKSTMEDRFVSTLTPQKFGRMLRAQPLNSFSQIDSFKGKGGTRMWKGLRLKEGYEWSADSTIVRQF